MFISGFIFISNGFIFLSVMVLSVVVLFFISNGFISDGFIFFISHGVILSMMVLFFISDGEEWHRQRVALQTVAINGKIIGQYLADQDQVRVSKLITLPLLAFH